MPTVYDTPNSTMDRSRRLPPPLSSLGSDTFNSYPASSATPSTISPTPITTVIHGIQSWTDRVTLAHHQPDDRASGGDAGRHRAADGQRPADARPGVAVLVVAAADAEEVREVGGKQREATRVERGRDTDRDG